jgi:hypothetical protein
MAEFTLPDDIVTLDSLKSFVPLGQPTLIFNPTHQMNEAVSFRVRGITEGRVNGFWGTVGRSDDLPLDWEGTLYCSGNGNDRSTGDVSRMIDAIRQLQPNDPSFQNDPILEKYVAFDEVEFGDNEASRSIRLTLMLEAGESAVLFYHYGTPGSQTQQGEVEYIFPAEGNQASTLPSRRTFVFTIPEISSAHNPIDDDDASFASRFLVKALVFKYDLPQQEKAEQYALVRYNHASETGFDVIDATAIDFTKKTLFLIHGTFATVKGSFRGLHKNVDDGSSVLQGFLDDPAKGYEQIIGFDHKTMADTTFENVAKLKEFFNVVPNWKFTQTVDIIGTSRGGLVAKTIAGDSDLSGPNGKMQIDKIIFASCPNGAAILDPNAKIAMRRVLSGIAGLTGPLSPALMVVFQLGATAIFNLPGLKIQVYQSPGLQQILDLTPQNNRTRYYPMCGNYKPAKVGMKILDFLIDRVLTDPNDWVNYTSRMNIMPAGKLAYNHTPEFFVQPDRLANAIHTNYFTTSGENRPATYVKEFLSDKSESWM